MSNLNTVTLLGNLTRDPELRYSTQGAPFAGFGLAVNQTFGKGENKREEVLFIDVIAFGRQAEAVAEHLKKGSKALVVGRVQLRTWEKNGQTQRKHSVAANQVIFLDAPQGGGKGPQPGADARQVSPPGSRPQGRRAAPAEDPDWMSPGIDDDIPF